jgi:ABC-type Fe3+/spermidine/putrescine transport system ATPase subunit
VLALVGISKDYENKPLLADVSFTVAAGETVCLLGASGSGKSTLLRIIAGLEPPDAGQVLWEGADLASTPPHARDFGLVFQDYALFPHLTVFDNAAFGLRMRNLPKNEIEPRVAEVLELVNLSGFEKRKVTDLSGGEQQRVALARALAPRPRLLMFDEPLGALDRTLKDDLLNELRAILHRMRIPAIYVTHDQEEAFAIADRVLLLHGGRIVRQGSPAEVWSNPGSAWAARFLGAGNVVMGVGRHRPEPVEGLQVGKFQVETEFGIFEPRCEHRHSEGDEIALLLKQLPFSRVERSAAEARRGEGQVTARVEDVLFQREQFKVTLRGGLVVYLSEAPKIGAEISVTFAVECLGHE